MRPTRVMAALLALGLLCCKKPEGARPPAGRARLSQCPLHVFKCAAVDQWTNQGIREAWIANSNGRINL